MLVIICHNISSQNVNQIILSCWHNSVPPADITLLGPIVLNHWRVWLLEEENYLRYTVLYMLTFQLWPVCSLFVYRVRSWVHSSALKHWMRKLVQRKEGAFLELCEKLMQTGKIFSCFSFLRSKIFSYFGSHWGIQWKLRVIHAIIAKAFAIYRAICIP